MKRYILPLLTVAILLSAHFYIISDFKEEINSLKLKENSLHKEMKQLKSDNRWLIEEKHRLEEELSNQPEYEELGTAKVTAYCPCSSCSDGWGVNTKSGRTAKEGITVAADPNVIPLGSTVIIEGKEYLVQDVGGGVKGLHIDIFFNSHKDAVDHGVQYKEILMEV